MGRNARIALAVGIGYVLGRRHRLRSALVLAAAAAAGRMSTDPQALRRLLPSGPQLGQVAGLGKPLADAGKAAATAAVSHGIDSVGDRLRRQADVLRGVGERAPGEFGQPERAAEREREEEREPEEERGRTEGRREEPGRAAPPEEYEREHQDYEEGQPDEEQRPEPEPEARRRKKPTARSAVAARPRRRAAEEEGGEAAQASRPAGRERPDTGGAPVRRRGR